MTNEEVLSNTVTVTEDPSSYLADLVSFLNLIKGLSPYGKRRSSEVGVPQCHRQALMPQPFLDHLESYTLLS